MSFTWESGDVPAMEKLTPLGYLRAVLRGLAMALVLALGVVLSLVLRIPEACIWSKRRPLTAPVTQAVSRIGLICLGLRYRREGQPMRRGGAVVANHSTWLDILALNAGQRIVFVSKAEVAGWPVIGWVARLTGAVFIRRDRRDAMAQAEVFRDRVEGGQRLLFFPEGTSTDGMRVLPFKSTLFEAFFSESLHQKMHVQPVTVVYDAPSETTDQRFYGWWGDMELGPHALQVLACARQGQVRVIYHPPLAVADYMGRKALSSALEAQVRSGMPQERQLST